MSFTNLIRVAIRAILSNKSRTLLSTLGIIIGVAAVIIMMSIGQGSKESIRKEISKMGSNVITVRPGADMRGGVRQDPSAMQTLKMSDYESMLSGLKYVQHVSPEVTQAGQVVNGNNNSLASEQKVRQRIDTFLFLQVIRFQREQFLQDRLHRI